MKINFLLSKNFFLDHCSYSFVFPIIRSANLIKDSGVNVNLKYDLKEDIFNCDILIIDSRSVGNLDDKSKLIEFLNKNKNKKIKYIFADTADNSGQIKVDFLKITDLYWKGQILKEKKEYMNSHYGGRYFTNYYNKKYSIKDSNEQFSEPIKEKKLLKKIKVCWNMGLCDHGSYSHIKQKLFSIFKSRFLISNTSNFNEFINLNKSIKKNSEHKKKYNLSCRIGVKYDRETVEFQRNKIKNTLEKYTSINKIPRYKYLNEMRNAKCVVSPFGWGELCPRDFETFLCGAILIKPDMSYFETWPNWYLSNKNGKFQKTYLPFKWDFSNLKYQIDFVLDKYQEQKKIALEGQKIYENYTVGVSSKHIFAKRFLELIKG